MTRMRRLTPSPSYQVVVGVDPRPAHGLAEAHRDCPLFWTRGRASNRSWQPIRGLAGGGDVGQDAERVAGARVLVQHGDRVSGGKGQAHNNTHDLTVLLERGVDDLAIVVGDDSLGRHAEGDILAHSDDGLGPVTDQEVSNARVPGAVSDLGHRVAVEIATAAVLEVGRVDRLTAAIRTDTEQAPGETGAREPAVDVGEAI